MTLRALDSAQRRAVEFPFEDPALALVGVAGSGVTTTLLHRAHRATESGRRPLLLLPTPHATRNLCARLETEELPRTTVVSLAAYAWTIVRHPHAPCARRDLVLISDARAAQIFEAAAAPLFALEWDPFIRAEIDPEIAGIRSPRRFAAAAFRLIRKLRAANLGPDAFLESARRGALTFYASPPNFASTELLAATGAKYRDSLRVDGPELTRQHRRELDLAKVLAHLYETYLTALLAHGALSETDVVCEAVQAVEESPSLAERLRREHDVLLIDDAQDLTAASLALLRALAGTTLAGVTLGGDPAQAVRTFRGALGERVFTHASRTISLTASYGVLPAIAALARRTCDARTPVDAHCGSREISFARARDVPDEARDVARRIRSRIEAGTPPREIAVITRSLRCARPYLDALLAADVAVDAAGDLPLYELPDAQDVLAALSSYVDPTRHDRLLRALAAPWCALSDASLAILCTAREHVPSSRARGRSDPSRDVRLARNVLSGERDGDLSADARERLLALRNAFARYTNLERIVDAASLARTILGETAAACAGPHAAGAFTRTIVQRFMTEIEAFVAADPLATLGDYLTAVEALRDAGEDLLDLAPLGGNAVSLLSVEAARGRTFDCVFLVDARAGAFPRYYVPDAFLFTPTLGMIPKDNVGDARAARTAKFTWALQKLRARERYIEEERRAFACAATRARRSLYVGASGRITRGETAPELETELAKAFESS